MKEKIEELLKHAQKIMGPEADFIIISHKDSQFGAVAHGNSNSIAQALFSCMHQQEQSVNNKLYQILKLVVLNTIHNPSPYTDDLLVSINNILPDDE